MIPSLDSLITKYELDEYREFITQMAKPSIELIPAVAGSVVGGRFGGSPDVPKDFVWPKHSLGLYRFFCQVDLSRIPAGLCGLPSSGLLSFFYAHDEDGECFWQDPDYVRVFHFANQSELKPMEPPEEVRFGSTCDVALVPSVDVRSWPWEDRAHEPWLIDESKQDEYLELRDELHPTMRFLMGYPLTSTLAYDPTPGSEWTSLITLSSDDELQWCWHDGDWLVSFIEKQRLLKRDFSVIQSDAG